ncbi:MAG: cation transporter [Deltaproteobacteria bacterium]|nr:cation transporter [Deltaproteobacteria bacterium]
MDLQQRKSAVALLSVVSNTLLVLFKLIVGLAIGSVSVISEAIHSAVDLMAACIALFAVRRAARPADECHPFGHGKVENVSGTVEALLIFVAAGWIIYEAVHKLYRREPLESVGWGVAVMLVSALTNQVVSRLLFKVGRETDSIALQADAWHLRTDVYTSAGVMVGLLAIAAGHRLLPGLDLTWVDPVAAILVALLILRAAWQLTVRSGRDLLDARLPGEEQAWLLAYLGRLGPEVCGYHNLRTRKAGNMRFIDLHVQVASALSVDQGHAIAHDVSSGIKERFRGAYVIVHIEPCRGDEAEQATAAAPAGHADGGAAGRKA